MLGSPAIAAVTGRHAGLRKLRHAFRTGLRHHSPVLRRLGIDPQLCAVGLLPEPMIPSACHGLVG